LPFSPFRPEHPHASRPSDRQTRRQPSPLFQAFSAICNCCETTGNSLTPNLPAGWQAETIGGSVFVYCGDCAIDLPRGGAR
jgi:hypothetical protein